MNDKQSKQNQNRPNAPAVTTEPTAETVEQLIAGPTTTDQQPEPAPLRRRAVAEVLAALYPPSEVGFRTKIREAGKPWSNGTVSQSLAEVIIPVHDPVTGFATGLEIRGARIVKKTQNGKATIELQMPSTGQAFRNPVIDTDDTRAEDGYNRWRKLVADRYLPFRTAEVAALKATHGEQAIVNVSDSALQADADMLTALGI